MPSGTDRSAVPSISHIEPKMPARKPLVAVSSEDR
jgi:hypothetical protein